MSLSSMKHNTSIHSLLEKDLQQETQFNARVGDGTYNIYKLNGKSELGEPYEYNITFISPNKLEVRGYADATGAEAYNQGLSQKRADTIMNYLGKNLKLQEASSVGYGESKESLLVPDMPESALNRRVEIFIEEIE